MTRIGPSALDVLPITLGANPFGWTADREATFAILDAFVAGGGSLVDTADSYSAFAPGNSGGESETLIGEWLSERGDRGQVVIATKVSRHPEFRGLAADTIRAAARASLERLQTESIDLYFAHYDDPETPLEESIAAFAELQAAGSILHVGLSNYTPARIREWLAIADRLGVPAPIALQPNYNLLTREPYESEVAPLAAEHGLGVLPYFGLGSGFLTGKYRSAADVEGVPRSRMLGSYLTESGFAAARAVVDIADRRSVDPATVALAWLRGRPAVSAPIASASRPEHVPALLAAATLELGDDELARLEEVSAAFEPAV
jgi:aryl-alcohol dehydrogenase-like predicted oxidoreductase